MPLHLSIVEASPLSKGPASSIFSPLSPPWSECVLYRRRGIDGLGRMTKTASKQRKNGKWVTGGRVFEDATAPSRRAMRPAPLGSERSETMTAAGQRSPAGRRTEKRRKETGGRKRRKREETRQGLWRSLFFSPLFVGLTSLCPHVWAFGSV